MLQWTGGSRRKVTASGRSTQKRQKQYFEQRKWQRQQELTLDVDNNVDGLNNSTHYERNNRSLDILSLLNVPNITEGCRATYSTGDNPSSADCYVRKTTPSINAEGIIPVNSVATVGTRTPSSQNLEKALSERFLHVSSNPSNHAYEVRVDGGQKDCNVAPSRWLSVLDLIGDDAITEDSEKSPVQEAHAAFSIKGLGKVGTDTPNQSPRRYWTALGDQSLAEAAKRKKPLKNFDHESDDFEMETGSFLQGDCLPRSFNYLDSDCEKGCLLDPLSGQKRQMSSVKEQLGRKSYKSAFDTKDVFNDVVGKNADFLNAASSLLHDDFLNEEGCGTWQHVGSNDDFSIRNNMRYPGKRTATFDFLDSSCQHQNNENRQDYDFAISDEPSMYSWSCLMAKDSRDSLDSFCGESCSSSAEWIEGFTYLPSARRRHFQADIPVITPRSETNDLPEDISKHFQTKNLAWPEERCERSVIFPVISNPSIPEEPCLPLSSIKPRWPPPDDPGLSACSLQSFDSSASSDAAVGKCTPDIHQEVEISFESSDLSNIVGSHRHMVLPTSGLSRVINDSSDEGDKLERQPSESTKFPGSCSQLSERGTLEVSRHDAVGKDQDSIPYFGAYSSEDVVKGLSRVWTGSKLGSCMTEEEFQSGCRCLHQCMVKDVEINLSGAEGSSVACEELMSVEPPSELMMLQSCVLQLVCVHKGKKLMNSQKEFGDGKK